MPAVIADILTILAPVFFLAFIGWCWVKLGFEYDIRFVTRLSVDVGMPALILSTLARNPLEPAAFKALALASLAFYVAMTAAGLIAVRLARLPMRVWLSPFVFGNTGNLGLPIALFAFGQAGLADAMVVFAVMIVLNFTLGLWVVTGKGDPGAMLRQPMVYACLIGGGLSWAGIRLPEVVDKSLTFCGQIAIPLMLITLGVAVARLSKGAPMRALVMSAVKAAAAAALGFWLADVFMLTGAARGAFVIQGLTPVAVTSYLLAEKFKAEPEEVAAFVVASTLLSLGFLPAALSALM